MQPISGGDKQVIFVHGMGPKPPRTQHRQEWLDALRHSLWAPLPDEAASMAYWANLRRQLPLRFRVGANPLDFASSLILRTLFHDVELYFHTDTGNTIRQRLQAQLVAASGAGQRVAVLSHSLGTVIAYEVLSRLPAGPAGAPSVELLITMGSPLGLPLIRRELGKVAFPPCLHRWLNAFDGTDAVTLPVQEIGGIYTRGGAHLVIDRMVRENHGPTGKRDAHHWFGYLTCQEVGEALSQFLIAP